MNQEHIENISIDIENVLNCIKSHANDIDEEHSINGNSHYFHFEKTTSNMFVTTNLEPVSLYKLVIKEEVSQSSIKNIYENSPVIISGFEQTMIDIHRKIIKTSHKDEQNNDVKYFSKWDSQIFSEIIKLVKNANNRCIEQPNLYNINQKINERDIETFKMVDNENQSIILLTNIVKKFDIYKNGDKELTTKKDTPILFEENSTFILYKNGLMDTTANQFDTFYPVKEEQIQIMEQQLKEINLHFKINVHYTNEAFEPLSDETK